MKVYCYFSGITLAVADAIFFLVLCLLKYVKLFVSSTAHLRHGPGIYAA